MKQLVAAAATMGMGVGLFGITTTVPVGADAVPMDLAVTSTSISGPSELVADAEGQFTVSVSSDSGVPEGTVDLYIDDVQVDSGSLDQGSLTFYVTISDLGVHTLEAYYLGDVNFDASVSAAHNVTVKQFASTTTLAADLSKVNDGDSVTLSAAVSGDDYTPDGTVTFFENGVAVATETLDAGGEAQTTVTLTGQGGRLFKAQYNGNADYVGSFGLELVTVLPNDPPTPPAVTGSLTVQGVLADQPINAPLPAGTYVSPFTPVGDGWDITGTLDLDDLALEIDMGDTGLIQVWGKMGQVGPATGSIDSEGNATLDLNLILKVETLSGGIIPQPTPVGDDCFVGPMAIPMTGAVTNGVVELSAAGFNVPGVIPTTCLGLGALFGGYLSGTNTSFEMSFDAPGEDPPALPNTLAGQILDTADQPIAGARVFALGPNGPVGPVFTDAAGDYVIDGLEAGSYEVYVKAAGYRPVYYSTGSDLGVTARADASAIALTSDDTINVPAIKLVGFGSISGTVTGAGGAPLAGVEVRSFDSANRSRSTTTDANGQYTFGELSSYETYTVRFTPTDPLYAVTWNGGGATPGLPVPVANGVITDVSVALLATTNLSGTVVDRSSENPIAGAWVEVFDLSHTRVARAFTDGSGAFSISGLPAGDYKVVANATNYKVRWNGDALSFAAAAPVTLTSGVVVGADFSLQPVNQII